MKKLIIFDFDGVIEDTLDVAFKFVGEQIPNLTLEEFQSWFDINFYESVKEKGIPFDGDVYYPKYENELRKRTIDPDIKKALEKLHERVSLSIVSSSHDDALLEYVARNGITNLFDQVWGAATHKSKIEKLTSLMNVHAVTPEETIFVTDTVGDVKEAQKVGIESVAVTWGFHPQAHLESAKPTAIVKTPQELFSYLG